MCTALVLSQTKCQQARQIANHMHEHTFCIANNLPIHEFYSQMCQTCFDSKIVKGQLSCYWNKITNFYSKAQFLFIVF